MKRIVYGAASAILTRDQGVIVSRVYGVVTSEAAHQLIAHITAFGGLANVVRYDSAVVTIAPDRLLEISRGASGGTPTAVVASADQLGMFSAYAASAMNAGILKAAFATDTEARSWASQQAAVRAHWLALRRALRSAP